MDIQASLLKRRWSVSVALAIVAAVLLTATVVSRWTHDVLFDTDSWTETAGVVGTQPEVIESLADLTSTAIEDALDAENRLSELLPDRLEPLSGLLATQINAFIEAETLQFFESDLYKDIWLRLNRIGHSAAVAIIRDEVPIVSTADGAVTVDLTPIVEPMLDRVFSNLVALGESIPEGLLDRVDIDEAVAGVIAAYEADGLPESITTVEVYTSDRLAAIQSGAAVLDRLVWVLPVLTLLVLVGAVYLAPNRARMTGLLLALAALSLLAAFVAINLIVGQVVSGVESASTSRVVSAVFDGITEGLEALLVILVVLGGLGALGMAGWGLYNRLRTD